MKIVILTGGKGSRLVKFSHHTRKAYLPLGNKRVLDHILERVSEVSHGVSCFYTSENDAGAAAAVAEALTGAEPVMVVCGDNYFEDSFVDFVAAYRGELLAALYDVGSLERARRYGVVEVDGEGNLVSLVEKPDHPASTLICCGLYIIPPERFHLFRSYGALKPQANIGDVLSFLRNFHNIPIQTFKVSGAWFDVGSYEGYERAWDWWLGNRKEFLVYCFDIDGTICNPNPGGYEHYTPRQSVIDWINRLHDGGNIIKLYTGRGSGSGQDWKDLTITQLNQWGVKYDELIFGKPAADVFIDDKALNIAELGGWLVVMVVGEKGAGKSAVCRAFRRAGFITFHNDTLYLKYSRLYPGENINSRRDLQYYLYREAEDGIREALNQGNVVYEATGTNPYWKMTRDSLASRYQVVVVKVTASPEVIKERLSSRDWRQNYPATGEHIAQVSRAAAEIAPDFTIENSGSLEELEKQVGKILDDLEMPHA